MALPEPPREKMTVTVTDMLHTRPSPVLFRRKHVQKSPLRRALTVTLASALVLALFVWWILAVSPHRPERAGEQD